MPLSEIEIKNLEPRAKIYRVTDSEGLCIEITTSGSKLWRWRYYYQGKEQMLALGKYPAISLAEARKKRDTARGLVDVGKHPTSEKKIRRLLNAQESDNILKMLELIGEGNELRKDKTNNGRYRDGESCTYSIGFNIIPIKEVR
jgi:hypothetical protein